MKTPRFSCCCRLSQLVATAALLLTPTSAPAPVAAAHTPAPPAERASAPIHWI